MNEGKDINLIAIKSLIECIDNRDIAEGGIFLDDDNAEFVADILRYHYELLTAENKMEQVAAQFGKKLGEQFLVRSCHPEGNCVGCFSKYGFEGQNQTAAVNVAVLLLLLTGKAVIVDE